MTNDVSKVEKTQRLLTGAGGSADYDAAFELLQEVCFGKENEDCVLSNT